VSAVSGFGTCKGCGTPLMRPEWDDLCDLCEQEYAPDENPSDAQEAP
jgi:hypothetical protein